MRSVFYIVAYLHSIHCNMILIRFDCSAKVSGYLGNQDHQDILQDFLRNPYFRPGFLSGFLSFRISQARINVVLAVIYEIINLGIG